MPARRDASQLRGPQLHSILCAVDGLAAGSDNVVTATARINGVWVPASNSLPLALPPLGAPILLTAEASTALSGEATASAPNGAAYTQARPGRKLRGLVACPLPPGVRASARAAPPAVPCACALRASSRRRS